MKVASLFTYQKKDTFGHSIDGRIKVIWLIFISISIFFLGVKGSSFLTLLIVILLVLSDISPVRILYVIRGILLFLVIAWIGNAIFTPGEIVYSLGKLTVTREGLVMGFLITIRLIFLFLASTFVSATTSSLELSEAFESLLSPLSKLRINVTELAFVLSLTIRSIILLGKEAEELVKSQEAKGIRVKGGLRQRIHSIYLLVVPLVFVSFRRSDELAFAMQVRGYSSSRKRIKLKTRNISVSDILFLLISIFLVVGFILI